MKKNTLILIIFNLINTAAQFGLIMILSRYLSQAAYATYRQFFLPYEVMAPLLGLGLSSTIFYFYPRYENKKRLLFVILFLAFLTSLLFHVLINLGLGSVIAKSF